MKSANQHQSPGVKNFKRHQYFLDFLEVSDFLRSYPGMAIKPTCGSELVLEGNFDFSTKFRQLERIVDSYQLMITIPINYPKEIPIVRETGNKIPPKPDYHVNSDGSLCLGSELRLLWILSKESSLSSFSRQCLEPYLYSISYKLKYGVLPYGELDHGKAGQLKDIANLLGLKSVKEAEYATHLLSMKKRHANKQLCPCGCGLKLGKCKFNEKIKHLRSLRPRSWFRSIIDN